MENVVYQNIFDYAQEVAFISCHLRSYLINLLQKEQIGQKLQSNWATLWNFKIKVIKM